MELPSVLNISTLREGYLSGRLTVEGVAAAVLDRIERHDQPQAWISRLARNDVLAYARRVALKNPKDLPLFGIPFAIKDNIDFAPLSTTAACPGYAYMPERSAVVVEKLIAAGAIPLGKTNLDQFANGLVGTRTPFGACHSVFSPLHISGGSSSGSAVVVAAGLVSFALGTDTAGSGRIPAAFNNIVGWKPSRGLISKRGLVPACKSLDCVSVFSLSALDADQVRRVVSGFDSEDPYSRELTLPALVQSGRLRLGVPRREQLHWFDDSEMASSWQHALLRLHAAGIELVDIDFSPFRDTAKLLYDGPWVAERWAAVGEFVEAHPEAVLPLTRSIISQGRQAGGEDVFKAEYRRMAWKRVAEQTLQGVDALLTPSAGRHYRLLDIEHEPLRHNNELGTYTNFMNLFDMAAVAVPLGFRDDGLPFGVTISQVAGSDLALLAIADRLHQLSAAGMGVARTAQAPAMLEQTQGWVDVAVCGAHLSGLPLNGQLLERGARLLESTRTAADYRLFALPNTTPAKPGLVYVPGSGGPGVQLEIWRLPLQQYGSFVAAIPAPLGIGQLRLVDGRQVQGFVCEAWATQGAEDITRFGGWRAWLAQRATVIE